MTKKIIISIVSVLILSIVGCFIGINWNSIKTLLSGSKIYTYEQIQDSYDKGYKDANTNETSYLEQLDYYRNLVEDNELEILNLKNTLNTLETTNKNNTQTIADLEVQKQTLETDVENLQSIKTENEETITNLNLQITSLQTRVDELTADKTANQNEIVSLKNQIANLQTLNIQLQRTNELNAETITSLNNQIANLNSQISEMNTQVSNNSSVVNTLNNRIAELEKSVSYYEQYIANLENGEQVVATFEFDGSVYNIQIVNKNDYAGVVTPTSTDYVKFNYWTVNGEQVDLTTYALTTNTTFVANVSYYYDVKFMIDNEVFNSQIVEKDTFAVLPEAPTKDGYVFDGWTSNGIDIVDITSIAITQNITFTAKFTKIHNVTFIYEDSTLATQTIKNGEYAQSVEVENTDYKKFNGWLLNGTIVDLTSYKITADTVLTASITYSHDVTFMVDDTVYSTQIVETGKYVSVPAVPTKDGYVFDGWSINGIDVINISNYSINSNLSFVAIFSIRKGLESTSAKYCTSDLAYVSNYILEDGNNIYSISDSNLQKLDNKNMILQNLYTFETNIYSNCSFIYNNFLYFSNKNNEFLKLNLDTFEVSTWFTNSSLKYMYYKVQTDFLSSGIVYFQTYYSSSSKYVCKYDFNTETLTKIRSVDSSWIVLDDYLFYVTGSSSKWSISYYIFSTNETISCSGTVSTQPILYYGYKSGSSDYYIFSSDGSRGIKVGLKQGSSSASCNSNSYNWTNIYNRYIHQQNSFTVNDVVYSFDYKNFGIYDSDSNTFTSLCSFNKSISKVIIDDQKIIFLCSGDSNGFISYFTYWF